jgi:hypothetical protein
MLGKGGEVVTRQPYRKVWLDHLLSKEPDDTDLTVQIVSEVALTGSFRWISLTGNFTRPKNRCENNGRSKESDFGVRRLTLCVSRLQFFERKTAVLDSQPCYLVF